MDILFIFAAVVIWAVALTAFEMSGNRRRRLQKKTLDEQMRAISLAMTLGRRQRNQKRSRP